MGGGQAVAAIAGLGVGVVDGQEAGDGLLFEPLVHVALGRGRAGGELARCRVAAGGERAVEAERAPEVDGRDLQAVDGGREDALDEGLGRVRGRPVGRRR